MEIQKYNIVIADTQFLIVEALTSLLANDERLIISGIAKSKLELDKVLGNESCQLLITDVAMFGSAKFNEIQSIKHNYPELSVIILTNSISKVECSELSQLGVKTIISKNAERDELFAAIDSALKGKKYYSDEILDLILETKKNKVAQEEPVHLTNSEIEIVRLIAGGLSTKEIAFQKNISFHTVNTHRKNIFRKIGVTNASELIMFAIKAGWIDNIEYYI